MNARATSFATPQDLRAYIKCRDDGGSPKHCLSVGDNGEGCFGDETWDSRGMPMVAIPKEEMIRKWGTKQAARGKLVHVEIIGGKSFVAECRDQGPPGVIDLNPAALLAAGYPYDKQLNTAAIWNWVD